MMQLKEAVLLQVFAAFVTGRRLLRQPQPFHPDLHLGTFRASRGLSHFIGDELEPNKRARSVMFSASVVEDGAGMQLPYKYDAGAISEYYSSPQGKAQLRSRTLFIARTLLDLVVDVGPKLPQFFKSHDWSIIAPALRDTIGNLGPTAIKLGQAAANRPDLIDIALTDELRSLQDSVPAFATEEARELIRQSLPSSRAAEILESLPNKPVAAASLSQVYRVNLSGREAAVKVLRPDARETIAMDSFLARRVCSWAKSLRGLDGDLLLKPALVSICDEFFSRLFEEMDLNNEAKNIERFASIYGKKGYAARKLQKITGGSIMLPTVFPQSSGGSVLTMSWIDGLPLTARGTSKIDPADLPIIRFGIEATLSQLLDEGVMHADPHGGNLLRPLPDASIGDKIDELRLAYLDFGLVSTIPLSVREGLCCAVAHFIFDRDYDAVAALFTDLQIIPASEIENATIRNELMVSLERMASKVLVFRDGEELPRLAFDELLSEFASLAPRFAFELPPYFLNNARALATLEGMAKSADPNYDCLQSIYPFALRRLLADPRGSPVLRETLVRLTHDKRNRLDFVRLSRLLQVTAQLSKRSRRRIVWDAVRSKGGRAFVRDVCMSWCRRQVARFPKVGRKG